MPKALVSPRAPSLLPARAPLPAPGAVARALRAQGVAGVSLLESGRDLDGLGQFSLLVARPLAVASAEPGEPLRLRAGPRELPRRFPGDPLRAAAQLLARLRPRGARPPAPWPFAGGALLLLSYDLGRRWERLPAATGASGVAVADAAVPDLWLAVHGGGLVFDHARGRVRLLGRAGISRDEARAALREAARAGEPTSAPAPEPARDVPCSFDAAAYRRAVQTARAWIRRGDMFEVNLSRRWTLPPLDPERCAAALRALAPAPFMADLQLDRERRLLSASPERFLRLDARGRASSWPIKGTRPRGATPAEDRRLRRELLASPKEAAELAMIVDLVRNDLGRVARPGSVRVRDARRVQSWPAVHHTVGIVEAELERGRDWADLVQAAFPPGSVTGAPKVRAMEVIDELEPVRRGAYCGAFGYVGWDGSMDLAVAIRIMWLERARALAHAGGAVLLDSDPAAEERETRTKARPLLRAAACSQAGQPAARAAGGR